VSNLSLVASQGSFCHGNHRSFRPYILDQDSSFWTKNPFGFLPVLLHLTIFHCYLLSLCSLSHSASSLSSSLTLPFDYIDLILREREAQAQTKNLVYAEFRGCGVSFFLFHSHRHQPKNSCCSLLILRAVVFFLLGFLEKLIILVHNSFFFF
jgi:hypothetical protein